MDSYLLVWASWLHKDHSVWLWIIFSTCSCCNHPVVMGMSFYDWFINSTKNEDKVKGGRQTQCCELLWLPLCTSLVADHMPAAVLTAYVQWLWYGIISVVYLVDPWNRGIAHLLTGCKESMEHFRTSKLLVDTKNDKNLHKEKEGRTDRRKAAIFLRPCGRHYFEASKTEKLLFMIESQAYGLAR